MSVRRALIPALVAAGLLASAPAGAQEIRVEGARDAEAVRAAVASALAGGAREGVLTVRVDELARAATMRFAPAIGAPVERVVDLPEDDDARARTLRWLAENVTRDEASELAAELARPAPSIAVDVPPRFVDRPRPPPDPCDAPGPWWPVSLGIVSPFSVPTSPPRTNVALSLVYQDVGRLDGAGFGTSFRVRCATNGALFSQAFALTEGPITGASFTSGFHVSLAEVDGAIVSTGLTVQTGRTRGALASGFVNVHSGPVVGAVIAPVNVGLAPTSGVHAALADVSTARISGAQLGFLDVARGFDGVQASFLNVSFGGESNGAQIGFVNVAKRMRGAQVGFFNVAEDVDAAVGLVSVSWARRIRPYAWASNLKPIQAGVLFEGKRVFSAVNLGRLASNIQDGDFVLGFELGVHLYRNDEEGVFWDALAGVDGEATDKVNVIGYGRWGTRVGYRFFSRLAPYFYLGNALLSESRGDPPEPTGPPRLVFELGGGAIF